MSTHWFEVNPGSADFALAIVNTGAAGYSSAWKTPGGSAVSAIPISAYNMPAGSSWQCQLLNGTIDVTKNTTTRNRRATWCDVASNVPTPVASSYALNLELAQDPDVKDGLQAFLFENDAVEAYFWLGLASGGPPRAVGRCYLTAAAFGGNPDEDLTATVSFDCSVKPQKWFGTSGNSRIIG